MSINSRHHRRYAGASPFSEDQSNIFFGREAATLALHRMIKQQDLTVLHAKSGIGKSSLIKAGLLPQVRKHQTMEPVEFRLFASGSAQARSPLETTKDILSAQLGVASAQETPLDKLLPNDRSIWNILKEIQLKRLKELPEEAENDPPLLLIFDQFEELFTYSKKEQLLFRSQIAEAMTTKLPQRYWDMMSLYEGMETGAITAAEKRLLMKPMRIKVLFAIREDRIHLLGDLSDYLPDIGKCWFKLDHLNEEEATRAIIAPAEQHGDFATKPFSYADDLRKGIINYLMSDYEGIESAQLQVICDAIDRRMHNEESRLATFDIVGELENITANYYWEKIGEIGDEDQELAARKLIEEQLIFEEAERRLTLFGGQITDSGITKDTLDVLIDSYLLRAEPDMRGGYNYEISHDSLVKPILEAKRERVVQERWLEQEAKDKLHKERLAQEIKENKKSKRINVILTILLGLSLLTVGTSFYYYFKAKANERRTNELLQSSEAYKKVLEASLEENNMALRKGIPHYINNANVYLESRDVDLAREELNKAIEASNKLQSTDFNEDINKLRIRIQALEK